MKAQVRTSLTAQTVRKIDEGHLLQTDQLESVRMLTNDQMDAASPLACVLIGQPTLRRMIRLGVLAALDQRIGLRYAMPPMTPAETTSYIGHHLKLAGRSDPLFSDDAITFIHEAARGLPRAVNNIGLRPSSPPTPAAKPSSTTTAPMPRSPRSRQTDHHAASTHTKAPPDDPGGAFQHPNIVTSNDAHVVILSDREQTPRRITCRCSVTRSPRCRRGTGGG